MRLLGVTSKKSFHLRQSYSAKLFSLFLTLSVSIGCLSQVIFGMPNTVLAQTPDSNVLVPMNNNTVRRAQPAKNPQPLFVLPARQTSAYDDAPGLGIAGDFRISEMTERLFGLIEGNAGALVMVLAGIAAIISAAFGAFRAAISLLVVAVGAFILRSLVIIFFNYTP